MFDQSLLTPAASLWYKLGIILRSSPTAVVSALFIISGLGFSLAGCYLIWQLQGQQRQSHQLIAQVAADYQHQQAETQPQLIQVYVAGAVEHSGVYLLEEGERVGQLIELAGGFKTTASQTFVNQQLNLARKLTDGEQIYIPTADEQQTATLNQSTVTSNNVAADLISINTASASELESLPGIGTKRAEDIIAGRPYVLIDDLVTKSVITQSLFDDISEQITP